MKLTEERMRPINLVRELFEKAEKGKCLHDVWALVTGMRGPDLEDDGLKRKTTSVLRSCVLTRGQADILGVLDKDLFSEGLDKDESGLSERLDWTEEQRRWVCHHFTMHANWAGLVMLGMHYAERHTYPPRDYPGMVG